MLTLLKDAVEQDLQPEPVEVRALIGEIVSVANARRLATVTMQPGTMQAGMMQAGTQRWLCTRPAALWRAVANVVDNAVRAAGPAGRVEVHVHDEAPNVVIEVIDDGPGFGRAPAGAASLGLGIVASLTRQCGGKLDVMTAHPHGVRVRLEFRDLGSEPLSPGPPAPTGQFAGAAGRSGGP
ncbi:MAG TPA: sensor histidine kinase [Pseudonocardiaceae bacterium]